MIPVESNIKIAFFLALLLGVTSCDSLRSNQEYMHGRLSVTSTGFIDIPIDSVSLNYSAYPYYYHNDTADYYIAGNEIINSVDFYDLNKMKLVRRNVYAKEGENGILFTHKIFVKSLDSIYLYCIDDKKILLTNFQGEVIDRYTIPDIQFSMTHMLAPFTIVGNNVFGAYMKFGDNRQQTGHKTMVKFDLTTGEFAEFGPPYPDVFSRHLYNNFTPYFTFGPNNNIVVQHGALPILFNYSITRDTTIIFNMRSRLQKETIVPDTIALEAMDMKHDFEELVQPSYAGIFYDRFNELYYSIYLDGIPVYDSEGLKNEFEDRPITIVVFNRNFEYLGEVPLERNKYYRNFIPTRLGLLIPTSHPKNRKSKDDILQFEIFDIREKSDL